MELVGALVLVVLAVIVLKLFGLFLKLFVWLLLLPFQILGLVIAGFLLLFLLPFGILGILFGAVVAPFILLKPLLPWLLAFAAIYVIARRRRS